MDAPTSLRRRTVLQGAAALLVGACATDAKDDSAAGSPSSGSTGVPPTPITDNADFYVTSCCGTPTVDRATWTCVVASAGVERSFDLAWLEGLGAREREHTLACIGGGPTNLAIGNAVWAGLPLAEVFAALGVEIPDDAVQVVFTGADGYTTAIPVSDLDRPVWLVWRMNGEALPEAHGTTVRLLVPGRYGMKNPKWIVRIELVTEPHLGFWETYGWSDDASYQVAGLIHAPADRAVLPPGTTRIAGSAFAGSDPVVGVEVSVDGGASWAPARITYAPGADVWTLWEYDWEAVEGEHTLRVRVTTASGAQSGPADDSTFPDGYGGGMAVTVTVRG